MTTSPDLGLPFIASQQAQPEVTHNDALNMLASLLKGVLTIGSNSPPGSPADGDSHIVGASPTGAWAGKANKIAYYATNAWIFTPGFDSNGSDIAMGSRQAGLSVYVQSASAFYLWSGSAWIIDNPALDAADIQYFPVDPGIYAATVQDALDELYAGGGGGGGSIEAYYAKNDASTVVNPTPSVQTAIISANIAASSSPRVFSVSGQVAWDTGSHGMRGAILLDGTQIFPNVVGSNQGINPISGLDGLYTLIWSGVIIDIPGDNAAHTISLSWESQGSTAAITQENAHISAIKVA